MLIARGIGVPAPNREGEPILPGSLDLHLHPGDFVGLTGPSGSGKTTALRVVAGLEARAVGELSLDGKVLLPDELPAYRRQVVYLPQLPPGFLCSGRETLERMIGFGSGGAVPLEEARVSAILAALGLEPPLLERPASDLSVGEGQRMSLLRALYLEPRVLLLDEPTSALDPESRDRVEAALRAWHAGGERAALLVTHDPALQERLCTRTISVLGGGPGA